MRNIISYFSKEELKQVTDLFKEKRNITLSGAGNTSSKAMVVSDILRSGATAGNVLWVISDESEQNVVKKSMETWCDVPVFLYKKRADEEMVTFPTVREFNETKRREAVEFVSRLFSNKKAIFIVDFNSLLQNFPDIKEIISRKILIKTGDHIDSVKFIEDIVSNGYEMSEDKALQKGQYYRIGDGLFIKPINLEDVYRIDIGF
ncbi:MAG: hypothetical protein AAB953_03860, partial [Patescibacteria group bacterium]